MVKEIEIVRKEMDENSKETNTILKDNSKECADRAHNLSKYIDQQLNGSADSSGKKYESLKNYCSKLTDQVKSHIMIYDEQYSEIDHKLKAMEEEKGRGKEELLKLSQAIEERLFKKVKEVKKYFESTWKANTNSLSERIDSLSTNVDKNFHLFGSELLETRKLLSIRIDQNEKKVTDQITTVAQDLENMALRNEKYEGLLKKNENKLIEITEINLFSQIGNIIENLQIINFYSILFFKIFLMVGVIALFLITNKNKKSQNLFLLIYFGTISVILSIYANFIFYFTISIILSLLVIYFYKNFKENPSQHRKLTFLAFLFILIGNTIEIFNVYSNIFYISYEILLFVGFSILFTNHLRIRNGKKKNKN